MEFCQIGDVLTCADIDKRRTVYADGILSQAAAIGDHGVFVSHVNLIGGVGILQLRTIDITYAVAAGNRIHNKNPVSFAAGFVRTFVRQHLGPAAGGAEVLITGAAVYGKILTAFEVGTLETDHGVAVGRGGITVGRGRGAVALVERCGGSYAAQQSEKQCETQDDDDALFHGEPSFPPEPAN